MLTSVVFNSLFSVLEFVDVNESVRISAARIERAFEEQDRDDLMLLIDAYKVLQYAKHAKAMIDAGDVAIKQLETQADTYRRQRDAAHHVIIEAGVEPVKDTGCECDECREVLRGMQAAGYAFS